jgi:hypothetical protein
LGGFGLTEEELIIRRGVLTAEECRLSLTRLKRLHSYGSMSSGFERDDVRLGIGTAFERCVIFLEDHSEL